jgi:tRNA-(ms[2]io[6]A)-hydroxylase
MIKEKTKLGLQLPSDPRWVNLTEMALEEVLTDHAFCEQKAATSCITLIQSYSEKEELVKKLAPIVTEEWGHFRLVLKELEKRNLKLGIQRKDEYVNGLMSFLKKGGHRDERLVDRLLMCALIEARSCERFRLLSLNLKDENLRKFYHDFMVAEAAHYKLFLELANLYGEKDKVDHRWKEFLNYEANLMASIDVRGDRIH